ncbi:Putative ribonuclease H protein At1g65750 [Linum perenne]
MNWDQICAPKEKGGLGLRQARLLNLAYMTKLDFLCFQKPDLLWVRVLQGKYLRESVNGITQAHRSSQSNTWKGICQAWPTMMTGARAGVRDGKLTSFWSSRWLDSGIVLANWTTELDPNFNPSDCVADFVEGDDGWNLDKLNRVLPTEIVEQVVGCSPSREELGPDNWLWGENHDRCFTVGSSYNLLSEQGDQRAIGNVMKIWKWGGPNHVKFFLWLTLHEHLLTNAERARRHLTNSTACLQCGSQAETVKHVLRDCPLAEEVWRKLGFINSTFDWR